MCTCQTFRFLCLCSWTSKETRSQREEPGARGLLLKVLAQSCCSGGKLQLDMCHHVSLQIFFINNFCCQEAEFCFRLLETRSSILGFLCGADRGPRLSVAAEQTKVVSRRGGNATLPCKIQRDQSLAPNRKMRIKWTKLTSDYLKEVRTYKGD